MSAGAFEDGKYESNAGIVYPVRVQPETKQLVINSVTNDYPSASPPAGSVTLKISGGKRRFGLIPRGVYLKFTGVLPTGYKAGGILYVPIFQDTVYGSINPKDTGTYLGQNVKVVGLSPERRR